MVRSWQIALARNTLKAFLPFQPQLRALKRRVRPYMTSPGQDNYLLEDGLRQIKLLREHGLTLKDANVLEIGPGWHPLYSVLFRLCDVRETTLADQEELLDTRMIRQALDYVRGRRALVEESLGLELDERVFEHASSREEYFEQLRVSYRVPFDWSAAPPDYFNAVVSRAVMEHIEPNALTQILSDLTRIVHPEGLMCHFIDNADHWEYVDKSISRVNFLQFSPRQWRYMGLNSQDYMNRLRHSDYLSMFRSSGFEILHEWARVDEKALEVLKTLPLAEPFVGKDHRDLATIETRIVAKRKEH